MNDAAKCELEELMESINWTEGMTQQRVLAILEAFIDKYTNAEIDRECKWCKDHNLVM